MHEASRLQPEVKQMIAAAQPRVMDKEMLRPLGLDAMDGALGGGLAAGKLHEVFADDRRGEASALGFAAMLALRVTDKEKVPRTMLWLREEATQRSMPLHGPGLADLGLDPGRLVLGILPDAKALLRAAADALRCASLGAVILELGGNPALLDLTASRRLALAAEETGVTPLLLRLKGARPMPSAAQTRWQVTPVLSAALEADAPGHPALRLSLLRQRGGLAGLDWEVEWDRDAVCFRPAAFPGARLPLSGGGSLPHDQAAERARNGRWRIAS